MIDPLIGPVEQRRPLEKAVLPGYMSGSGLQPAPGLIRALTYQSWGPLGFPYSHTFEVSK